MKFNSYFILMLVILSSACSKNDDDNDSSNNNGGGGGTTTININSPWQYEAKIDGVSHSKIESATVIGSYFGGGSIATPPDSTLAQYGSALMNDGFTFSYFDIQRNGHYFLGSLSENSDFLNFFHEGSYSYSGEDVNGVSLNWRDDNGVTWGTGLGTGDQTGSHFVIDEVKVINGQIDYTIKVLAHFDCKLYDGNGNSKTLTEGKFVGQFANY